MSKKGIICHTESLAELMDLTKVLDDSLDLLNSIGIQNVTPIIRDTIYPNLFDQCIELCRKITKNHDEPIRTIHHLSCTGGTLITKCLAAMPNVTVLNEVDPLSKLNHIPDNPYFTPTDIISLARQGKLELKDETVVRIFLLNLEAVYSETQSRGKRLLIRDHSHSHFLTGGRINERPNLLALINRAFNTLSVVTVRNPVDSFLALKANGWLHFEPSTFDEYCRRYNNFLDVHSQIPYIRYEDFVSNPKIYSSKICNTLDLKYSDYFVDTFDTFRFSGDSGRSGNVIESRERRATDLEFIESARNTMEYRKLIKRLEYSCISEDL